MGGFGDERRVNCDMGEGNLWISVLCVVPLISQSQLGDSAGIDVQKVMHDDMEGSHMSENRT